MEKKRVIRAGPSCESESLLTCPTCSHEALALYILGIGLLLIFDNIYLRLTGFLVAILAFFFPYVRSKLTPKAKSH